MKSLIKKTLMTLSVFALLFLSNTASGQEVLMLHDDCECPDYVY